MPTIMKTIYILDDGSGDVLGEESSSGISEVLFPDANFCDHVMTITKKFEGRQVYRWEVTGVMHTAPTDTIVMLSPRAQTLNEEYLLKTILCRQRPQILSVLVRKGTLVEVEFGYIHSVKKASGVCKSNKRYPDQGKKGEMHKRRLAIVVGADHNRVQIVPITSRSPSEGDNSSFEVSAASLQRLVDYNRPDKHSYALCGMIQTISPARVLPPKRLDRAQKHVKRNISYPDKLVIEDMKKLEVALSSSIGIGDYGQVKSERNALRLEKQAAVARQQEQDRKRAELEQQLASLLEEQQQLKIYKSLLWDMYGGIHANLSEQELAQFIEGEVAAHQELAAI